MTGSAPAAGPRPGGDREEAERARAVLVRYVRARVRDEHAVQDLVQDTFLAAAISPRRGGELLPYLLGIARYKCIDWQRATAAARVSPLACIPDGPCEHDGPEALALRSAEVDLARGLLATLPDRDAELLLLRMAGCSAAETGAALGMSAGAVRVSQHRALTLLRTRHEAARR